MLFAWNLCSNVEVGAAELWGELRMKKPAERDTALLVFFAVYSATMIAIIIVATRWFLAM